MTPAPTAASTDVELRPLRRDAAENKERLLQAATQVFAERGLDAGVEEIARVAGVGMGTLYRRFPTKDALIEALVDDILEALLRLAEQAGELPDGTGLEAFLETSGAYQAAHRGCLQRLWTAGGVHETVAAIRRVVATLLADAKRHGRVRTEITATDITMVMWSIRGVIETTRDSAPQAWRRHLDILIAGLRPTDQVLSHPPMTRAQVDQVVAGR